MKRLAALGVVWVVWWLLLIYVIAAAACSPAKAAFEYHVAPNGDDTAAGTAAAPFATLSRARDAVRALPTREDGGTVWLRAGVYNQTASVTFDARDSGSADRPVVYAARPGDVVRITGARPLNPAAFAVVAEGAPAWARLDAGARGHVYSVDLTAHGITDTGRLTVRGFHLYGPTPLELFADGRPLTLARWPNQNEPMARTAAAPTPAQVTYAGTRPERWSKAADVWVHGFWRYGWADYHLPLAKVDTREKSLTFAEEPLFGTAADQPFYVYNLLEELDEPGEYFVDRAAGVLYLWPTGALGGTDLQVSMLEAAPLSFHGSSYITLRSLTVEASRGNLVEFVEGHHLRVEHCTLRGAGQMGAVIYSTDSGLDHCEVVDCGDDGARIGMGNRASLTPGNAFVTNCVIRRTARVCWTSRPGVYLMGCGGRVANNLLEDMPHSAIVFTGNEHTFEANEIRRVCRKTRDAGAIYTGRDWGYRGNVIRGNLIHDIQSENGPDVSAVYLDDCASGIVIAGNVFARVSGSAVNCGGGRDNLITNNIFAECGVAHYNDDRGRWQINDTPGDSWNLRERLSAEGIKYQSGVWAAAYPACAAIPNAWATLQTGLWRNPGGSVFAGNVGWGNGEWGQEFTLTGTGVFAAYASFAGNDPACAPLFSEVGTDRAARAVELSAPLSGWQPIPFRSIGPSTAPQRVQARRL